MKSDFRHVTVALVLKVDVRRHGYSGCRRVTYGSCVYGDAQAPAPV